MLGALMQSQWTSFSDALIDAPTSDPSALTPTTKKSQNPKKNVQKKQKRKRDGLPVLTAALGDHDRLML